VIEQSGLPKMPAPVDAPPGPATRPEEARVVRPVRSQIEWAPRELDALIPEDHQARAVWAYLERLDLSGFYASIKAVGDRPGRPASDPRVLLALWLFAHVEGVGSARRLGRLCEEHDAYRWIRGGVPVDYHLLAEFRVTHQAALDDLLTKILATMMAANLVTLSRVAQDGMRTRASAGAASFVARPAWSSVCGKLTSKWSGWPRNGTIRTPWRAGGNRRPGSGRRASVRSECSGRSTCCLRPKPPSGANSGRWTSHVGNG